MVALLPRTIVLLSASIILCQTASAAAMTPEEIDAAYVSSYVSEGRQDYLGAIKAMHPVHAAYPKGYTVNFRLGWLSYLNGNFADALRCFSTALTVYPASIEVMQCVSLVHKARQEWQKVETQNHAIIMIDPFNQTANYWYVVSLKMQKKYDQADKLCRKMLTVFPTSVTFLCELGEVLYLKKDRKEALAAFRSVKTLDPSNAAAERFISLIEETGKQ